MENKNNDNENIELFPDIEFLDDDIDFENDITKLEDEDEEDQKKVKTREKTKEKAKTSDKKGKTSSESKKKKSKFKLGLLIYAIVLLVITIGVWAYFYSFIDGYEKGMAYNAVDEVAVDINNNGIDKYIQNIDGGNEFEGSEYVYEYIKNLVSGKTVTYKEATDNTASNPSYELMIDEKTFAKVTFVQDGTIKHDFKNWAVESFSVSEYIPETKDVTILAPVGSKITINGIEVSNTYLVEENVEIPIMAAIAEYMEYVPTSSKYEVKGFYEEPVVEVKDAQGNVLETLVDNNVYTAGFSTDEETEEEFMEFVENVTYAYARNFANLSSNLYNYLLSGSSLREDIASVVTYFYPDSKLTGTDFVSREITDFVRYTDDCFSCHVSYEFAAYFNGLYDYLGNPVQEEVSRVDETWVFIRKDDSWYLIYKEYYVNSQE